MIYLVKYIKCYLVVSIFFGSALAKDTQDIEIAIENHKFTPSLLEVKAGNKIRLIVTNKDETTEEFESIDLKREKIVPGRSTVHVVLAPLEKGEYRFFGDFHQDTAQGLIIAK